MWSSSAAVEVRVEVSLPYRRNIILLYDVVTSFLGIYSTDSSQAITKIHAHLHAPWWYWISVHTNPFWDQWSVHNRGRDKENVLHIQNKWKSCPLLEKLMQLQMIILRQLTQYFSHSWWSLYFIEIHRLMCIHRTIKQKTKLSRRTNGGKNN